MARSRRTSGRTSAPVRSLLALLAVLIVLYGIAGAQAAVMKGVGWTPKLGLDLQGGTQIVLEPVVVGGGTVTADTLTQSVDIIRARIDGSGVGEAEITTEGGRNVVVSVPGELTDEQAKLIQQSSQLRFRAVLVEQSVAPIPTTTGTSTPAPGATGSSTTKPGSTGSPSSTAKPSTPTASSTAKPGATSSATSSPTASQNGSGLPQALLAGTRAAGTATTTPTPSSAPTPSTAPTPAPGASGSTSAPTPKNGSDLAQVTPAIAAAFTALSCADTSKIQGGTDDASKPLVTCSTDRRTKYILGPAEVQGTDISDASAGLAPTSNGGTSTTWQVLLDFNSAGSKKFADVTSRLYTLSTPQNQFGIVLDGLVISSPFAQGPITGGQAQITGNFTQTSALALAQQLKYGALPISFTPQTTQTISPLLGSEQLQRGLLAGLIGLALVVLYSLLQYRALGLVTIASLLVAGGVTYAAVVVLGTTQGFRLSLAGVTGLIVSIGVTADSFIVYFERVRDEVRDGRSLRSAVETGWKRAQRTILAADAINFLAAAVLYILAAGSVRGFAYTLGLSTLIDVLVVFLFTHPTLTLLARTRFFGQGHRFSGLDPQRLGSGIALGVKANLGTIASRRAAAATASNRQDA